MCPFQITKKMFWLQSGRLILAALFLSSLLGNLAQAQDSSVFPEDKLFYGGEMTHRYHVIGTTSGAGKEALQRIVDAKNIQLTQVGLPPIRLFDGPAGISIAFDHVKDIRDSAGNLLLGSNAEQFRVSQGVICYWDEIPDRYVFFIFDTMLRSNNAAPPNNELAAIQRSIQIGKTDNPEDVSSEAENLNFRAVNWDMESLVDPDRWIQLKAKFAYDLEPQSMVSFPDAISSDTHVMEYIFEGVPLDVVMPYTNILVTFDRRYYRVEVSMQDMKKLKLEVSSPNSDVHSIFDHAEWNEIREEVYTSSTFLRYPFPPY